MKALLLTSSTGGGHDMRADSFAAWASHPETASLELETSRLQTLEQTHRLYDFGVDTYNWIQRRWPTLHHAYFNVLEYANLHRKGSRILGRENFIARLEEEKPDILLSTHAHLNHGFFDLGRAVLGKQKVTCITYCGELFGEYGFSRHWVNPGADLFIGAVEETCHQARQLGMEEARNWCGGFLLKPPFYEEPLSPTQRRDYVADTLGLDPDRFLLVLSTGANAAVNHLAFLDALERSRLEPKPQVVALCGRREENKALVEAWAAEHPNLPVRTLGYFTDMHKLMQAASAIVARPGTGTTSEAIRCRCPVIFNTLGGIMPQEYITVKYARSHGFAYVINQPAQLPFTVGRMMRRDGLLERIRGKMKEACPRQRPPDIVQRVCDISA